MENDNFKTILDAGRASGEPIKLGDSEPAVIIPNDYRAVSLEHLLEYPVRKRGVIFFQEVESFTRYVTKHKDGDATIILLPVGNTTATAIFDHHAPDFAGWAQHRAVYTPVETEAWKAWSKNNKAWFSQLKFAEFLEERAADVVDPPSADFKQMALTLEATRDVEFKSALRLENGDVQIGYKQNTTAKSGQMDFPTEFVIRLQALSGQPPVTVQAFLRHRLEEGKISFKYELRLLDAIMEEMREDIRAQIVKDTGIEPFAGNV